MQIERVDHHEIIGQAEILHSEPIAIDQVAAGEFRHLEGSRHPLGIDGGIVAVGEAALAAGAGQNRSGAFPPTAYIM